MKTKYSKLNQKNTQKKSTSQHLNHQHSSSDCLHNSSHKTEDKVRDIM